MIWVLSYIGIIHKKIFSEIFSLIFCFTFVLEGLFTNFLFIIEIADTFLVNILYNHNKIHDTPNLT